MKYKKIVLLGLFILGFASYSFAQGDFAGVEIKTTKVAGNIYMLEGAGGNIGVSVGDDGILMIDDQFAPLSKKIRAALAKLSPGNLKFVLNTHWHPDHVGGNIHFSREASIIAHSNVRGRMEKGLFNKFLNRQIDPYDTKALPIITFDESLSIHFNGEEIKVLHYPEGHTDGDSIIFFAKSKVIHMGDHFFSGKFPFVDLESGGDVAKFAENVKAVLNLAPEDVKIIPGHGRVSNIKDLEDFHAMLLESIEIVINQIQAGKSLAEIQAEGLPEKYASWGTGFISQDQWLGIVHASLTKQLLNKKFSRLPHGHS